jgi:hypothetical protein
MTMLFILALIGTLGIAGALTTPATAQMYAQCCANGESDLDQFEWASAIDGTTWNVEGDELVVRDITFDFVIFVIKDSIWQDLGAPSDFTIEVKATEFEFGNKDNVGWWYVVLRYSQVPVAGARTDMFKWTFDEEGGNNGLYMYQWVGGQRIRYVAGQVADAGLGPEFNSHTRVGEWINDPGAIGEDSFNASVDVTATTVTARLNGEVEVEDYPNDTNAGGRPGLATWSDGGAIHFTDLMIFGPDGPTAVDPADKVATTWGNIKATP